MIIETKESNIKTVGQVDLQLKKAGISADSFSKLASLVTKNINSNPVKYCIQEVISNAVDSYKGDKERMLKNPIQIWADNNQFIVQDFGVGIDLEQFENVVMPLGASDKTSSNIEIGGFGLGFRSPLAVSPMFMCESSKDGVKRSWTILEDEEEVKYTLDFEGFTDEPNGTKITIPLVTNGSFLDNLKFVVQYQSGIVVNHNDFEVFNNTPIIEGQYFIYRESCHSDITLGTVPYTLAKLRYRPYAVKFNIGELNPTISRETVETTGKQDFIEKRINDAQSEFLSYLDNKDTFEYYFNTKVFNTYDYNFKGFKCSIRYGTLAENESYYATFKFLKPRYIVKGVLNKSKYVAPRVGKLYKGELRGNLTKYVYFKKSDIILIEDLKIEGLKDVPNIEELRNTKDYLEFCESVRSKRNKKTTKPKEFTSYFLLDKVLRGAGFTFRERYTNYSKSLIYYSTNKEEIRKLGETLFFMKSFKILDFAYVPEKNLKLITPNFVPIEKFMLNKTLIKKLSEYKLTSKLNQSTVGYLINAQEYFKLKRSFIEKDLFLYYKDSLLEELVDTFQQNNLLDNSILEKENDLTELVNFYKPIPSLLGSIYTVDREDCVQFLNKVEANRRLVKKQKEYIKILKSKIC